MRAIAVLAVVLYHAQIPLFQGGYVGVDIFFVISGFLITSHLLGFILRTGRVPFGEFYAKRARRILPASFVILVLSVIGALLLFPPVLMRQVWMGAVATALYVPNILFGLQGVNYLAETTPSLFQHYWSLGIEEQFYLVWPLLMALSFWLFKRTRWVFWTLAVVSAVSFVASVVITPTAQPMAFFMLPTRAWELGVGGLIAFATRSRPQLVSGTAAGALGWLGVASVLASIVFFSAQTSFPGYMAAIPVAGTAAVIVSGAGTQTPAWATQRFLSIRPLVFIGLISYSIYLIHWPLIQLTQAAVGFQNPLPIWANVALSTLSVPLAYVLFRFVETPGRNLNVLVRGRASRTLWSAAAGSLACVLVATGARVAAGTRPESVAEAAPAFVASIDPVGTGFVPSNLDPELTAAMTDYSEALADGCNVPLTGRTPTNCVYGDPEAPRLALFGDSHALQWLPTLRELQEQGDFSIALYTKDGCTPLQVTRNRSGGTYLECDLWRDAALVSIANDERIELVIMSSRTTRWVADGEIGPEWKSALEQTITDLGRPAVVIADTPTFRASVPVCLSAELNHADHCAVPTEEGLTLDLSLAEKEIVEGAGAAYIDMNPYLCNQEYCPAVLGNILGYRDVNHMTNAMARALAPAFLEEAAHVFPNSYIANGG